MKTRLIEKINVSGMLWVILTISASFSACTTESKDRTDAEISNGLITAKLHLPDMENGYYQATRFDWAGIMTDLEFEGHSYFGQWFANYDPKIHDAICGPVESFSEIGYQQAEVGGEFLRIGVGGLLKADDSRFDTFKLYQISNPGQWKVKKSANQVVFTHEVKDVAGYSYLYTKTVRLPKGEPKLILEHTLKNTGKKVITTDVYNHNFFVIDHEPTGPYIRIRFPFDVSGQWNREDSLAVINGQTIQYTRDFRPRETVFMGDLQGHSRKVEDYDFRIENLKTGAGVRITCDRPISKIVFWASATTSCPEPYIDINVPPGEQFTWTIAYEFYVFQTQ